MFKKLAAALVVAVASLSGTAHAEDSPPVKLHLTVTAATDSMFRGVSQTDEKPVATGALDATIGKIGYIGAWAANTDYGNGTDFEVDIYGGVRPQLGKVALDFGVIYATYQGQPADAHQNYWEFKAAASAPIGPATVGLSVNYSPEFFGKTGKAAYVETTASLPIPRTKLTVSGAIGYQWVEESPSYVNWNLGASYQLNDMISVDVRYYDTAKDKFGPISKARVVGGVRLAL